jgi:hypothetical protein
MMLPAEQMAAAMARLGVGEGTRVVPRSPNGPPIRRCRWRQASTIRRASRVGAEVGPLNTRVGQERVAGTREHHPSDLEHVPAFAQLQRLHDPLLDQQNSQPALAPDAVDRLEDLLDVRPLDPGSPGL